MDPETKEILDETLELSKENNKMLKKLRNAMRVSRAFKIVYWTVIIGSMLGVYYYFQPFIDNIRGTYEQVTSFFGKGDGVTESLTEIGSILKK